MFIHKQSMTEYLASKILYTKDKLLGTRYNILTEPIEGYEAAVPQMMSNGQYAFTDLEAQIDAEFNHGKKLQKIPEMPTNIIVGGDGLNVDEDQQKVGGISRSCKPPLLVKANGTKGLKTYGPEPGCWQADTMNMLYDSMGVLRHTPDDTPRCTFVNEVGYVYK